jgi:hypothetical protein
VRRPLAWADDLSRFEFHFFDTFGDKALAWMATEEARREMIRWLTNLQTRKVKRDGKPLAGRSCWNIASSVTRRSDLPPVRLPAVREQRLAGLLPRGPEGAGLPAAAGV